MDILITASTFTPVPSLSAMVASYFGMRSDVLHYSLAGQGCTSGIIEVELAQHLLKARPHALPGKHWTATPPVKALLASLWRCSVRRTCSSAPARRQAAAFGNHGIKKVAEPWTIILVHPSDKRSRKAVGQRVSPCHKMHWLQFMWGSSGCALRCHACLYIALGRRVGCTTTSLWLAQAKAGRVALLVAHENITNGFYPGNDKSLLVANVLFKLGGSAAILSTRCAPPTYRCVSVFCYTELSLASSHASCRQQDRRRAKYELLCTERTLRTSAADLDCIQCAPSRPILRVWAPRHLHIRHMHAHRAASLHRRQAPCVLGRGSA